MTVGLIETFRWSREGGYDYLPEHLERLQRSARALRLPCRREAVERRLAEFAAGLDGSLARVRLVLIQGGALEITATALDGAPMASHRVVLATPRHRADDPWLRHKVTRRDRYEQPLAEAVALGASEVLFLNREGQLCEGARTNLFVRRGDDLLTPPLHCGLLPGTLRAHLIRMGLAREAVLGVADLGDGAEWFLGNSVRGLVPASLIEA